MAMFNSYVREGKWDFIKIASPLKIPRLLAFLETQLAKKMSVWKEPTDLPNSPPNPMDYQNCQLNAVKWYNYIYPLVN